MNVVVVLLGLQNAQMYTRFDEENVCVFSKISIYLCRLIVQLVCSPMNSVYCDVFLMLFAFILCVLLKHFRDEIKW